MLASFDLIMNILLLKSKYCIKNIIRKKVEIINEMVKKIKNILEIESLKK